MWARDGREILWVPSATSGQHAVVSVSFEKGVAFSVPNTFAARVARTTSGQFRSFDSLPDGRIVGTLDPAEAEVPPAAAISVSCSTGSRS